MWRDGRRDPVVTQRLFSHGLVDHGDSNVAVLGQGDR